MKTLCISTCIAATLIPAANRAADFLGVTVERTEGGDCLTTFRLFARFSSPTDQLLAVSGTPSHSVYLVASQPLWNDGGVFAGLRQEDFAAAPISDPRDSWVTIGADGLAGNDTQYSPGFLDNDGVHAVIGGTSFSDNNDGWYDSNLETPVTGTEILIAQFSFGEGVLFFEFGGIANWRPEGGTLQSDAFVGFYGKSRSECPQDLDLSEAVDFSDLLLLLHAWGACPDACCPADFDDDGAVGLADLLLLLGNWGPCF